MEIETFGIVTTDPELDLFTRIGPSRPPEPLAAIGAIEEWPVDVNLAHLRNLPESIILNLPGQEPELLARQRSRSRTNGGGFLWTGGSEGCSALLSAIPTRFRAIFSCLYGTYGVETRPTGTYLTRYEHEPAPAGAELDIASPLSAPASLVEPVATGSGSFSSPLLLDEEIKVLILYTANVRQALQAASIDVQQYMEDTLATTQLAMDRSTTPGHAIIAELTLAHAQEVARTDNPGVGFSSDLFYLSTDPVATGLRSTHAADLVMLIRETTPDPGLCGLANVPNLVVPPGCGFAPSAVGVTKRECSFSPYSFQHEFGHLFGGNHNPENNSNNSMLHAWAQAHWANAQNPEDSARTLLSYQIGTCHGSCPQVLNYSNAAITLTKPWSFRTGIAGQRENALIIEEFALVTAQYQACFDLIFAHGFE